MDYSGGQRVCWPSPLKLLGGLAPLGPPLPTPMIYCYNFNLNQGVYNLFNQIVSRWIFCFGSLVILDVVRRYLSLFLLYIHTEIGKINVKCYTS